jgi:hypothetical protein
MEEVVDFDKWVSENSVIEVTYWAVYDIETGKILGVYPNNSADQFQNKIQIKKDLAEMIAEGKILLRSCFVDITSSELEIIESQSLRKIDDVLHRVIDKQWTSDSDPDIVIEYFQKIKKIKVSMTERFYGTNKSTVSDSKRKIDWKGSTEILLSITDYNDPNVLYYTLSLKVTDLVGNAVTFNNIELDKKFSIYTRRVFKNYVLEVK